MKSTLRDYPSLCLGLQLLLLILLSLSSSHIVLAHSHTALSTAAQTAFDYAVTAQDSANRLFIDVTDITAPNTPGAALLTILADNDTTNNNVQASTATSRSLRIQNTGEKRIAAVYLHMENAIIPDMVVIQRQQQDGVVVQHEDGGVTQPVASESYQSMWCPARSTSSSGSTLFDPMRLHDIHNLFADELSDTGTVEEGFRGLLLLFRGFDAGEVYEGSTTNLVPHSLSGLPLTTVNEHAAHSWDVGGVSGAELVNSAVTVLFGDGSSATSVLASDGSQAGAIAVVVSDGSTHAAPSLLVNGLETGWSGDLYGPMRPHVSVSSEPGDTVRVTKMSALVPVENQAGLADGSITIEALVTARLVAQYPTFPVNNAKELQHVEIVIPASGSLDISDLFQYNTGEDYAVAFTAVTVDGSGVPLSRTTIPTRLLSRGYDPGNLLVNGSFESNPIATNSRSLVDPELVEGWFSLNGADIELFGNGKDDVTAIDGSVFLKLGASTGNTADGVYQDVVTQKDREYELTFYIATEDETLYVEWNGKRTSAMGYRSSTNNEWEQITVSLIGSGGTDRLSFIEASAASTSDGTGPFLDLVLLRPAGNMIVNGSFESTVLAQGKYSQRKDRRVQGWLSTTGTIELWGPGVGGAEAFDGSTLLELDVHGPVDSEKGLDGIFQHVLTERGRLYQLSFYVRARSSSFSSSSESLSVQWRGHEIKADYHAAGAGVWTRKVVIFEGSGSVETIVFREISSDGLGPLLDNIELSPLR